MPMTMVASHVERPRLVEGAHRFLAFAFAASEMVVEADPDGTVTYAAGAFRSRLGMEPESVIGRHVSELVAASDWDSIHAALLQLRERGRLLPCIVRLANPACSSAVLAGLRLIPDRPDSPICFTIGLPPALPAPVQVTTPNRLTQAAQSRFDLAAPGHVALLELAGGPGAAETLNTVLGEVSPQTMASEVAPGRFGLLTDGDVDGLLAELDAALRRHDGPNPGGTRVVSSHQLPLDAQALTRSQAALAVRQALTVFARNGAAAMDGAGFGNGLAAYVQGALSQLSGLRKAIAQRDFTIAYQPVVDLATRQIHHFEGLLRPARSITGQGTQDFISLIETVGLTDELDMAVATMVCEAADRGTASVAFNLSGHSVQNPVFRERLLTLFRSSRAVQAGRLLAELTETAPVESLEEAAETARCLRSLGVRFCIDDFGAGAADIRLLRALPTDLVKLDGSFVAGLLGSGKDRAFVTGMVEIARAAGAKIVAERIETEAEAEAAMAVGASFGQGWLFGRPGPLPAPPPSARPVRAARRQVELDERWG